MKNRLILTSVLVSCVSANIYAAEDKTMIKSWEKGNTTLSKVVVDTAPGNVSAMNLLGTSPDQTGIIENPRNLTLALKAFDSQEAFGLSITPARTSLIPMDISAYNSSNYARLWASTTFSYAQGQASINNKEYDRRAFSVETSYFFLPDKDDPLVMYWNELSSAVIKKDSSNPCLLIPDATAPDVTSSDVMEEDRASNEEISKRAQICRDATAKKARWNVSRMWASLATGQFQPADGGDSHSLGKTAVLGLTWGIGDKGDRTASALTLAIKRTTDSPTLQTFGNASPTLQNNTVATLRAAMGSETIRILLEGSNVKNDAPTAANRAYKRALGMDLKVSEEFWLNLRFGTQRRIDNSGDERGSSFALSYSPKALLNF